MVQLSGGVAGAQGPAPLAVCGTTHWVGAWAADPSGTLGSGFTDQTVRIVITPHIAGSALRVHISNVYGATPLRIADATVAQRQSAAGLVAGSIHGLTFSGAAAVTVPAGGEVVSDRTSLTFTAFEDLAVSLYLPGPTGPATGHLIARERSYASAQASGDHTSDAASGAFVGSSTSSVYVDAVDAVAPASAGAAVVLGDSLTDGYEAGGPSGGENTSGIDSNLRYPDDLARRLLADPAGPQLSVVNAGIGGNRLLADAQQGDFGASALSRLDADVLGVPAVTDAIVLEGINDIANQAPAASVENALTQIVTTLHAAGIRVVIGTILPATTGLLSLGSLIPGIYVNSPADGVRSAVNAWIRAGSSGADGVVDFDAVVRNPATPNELAPGFDSGDHIHPNDAGYAAMANAIDLSGLSGPACAPPPAAPPRVATRLRLSAHAESGRRIRVTGSLPTATPTKCTRAVVAVRALHGGHSILARRVALSATCHFAATESIHTRGRVEVRVSFAGTPTLLPAHAQTAFVRVS